MITGHNDKKNWAVLAKKTRLRLQFFQCLWVCLAADGGGVAVRVELQVWAVQIPLVDTATSPALGPGGKVTTGKPHPISMHATTEGEKRAALVMCTIVYHTHGMKQERERERELLLYKKLTNTQDIYFLQRIIDILIQDIIQAQTSSLNRR